MKKYILIFSFLLTSLFSFAALDPITGVMEICGGSVTPLSHSTPGGTWSSSNTTVATITSLGQATGITAGTTVITYTAGTEFVTKVLTVLAIPSPTVGNWPSDPSRAYMCYGDTLTLYNATTGGGDWNNMGGTMNVNILPPHHAVNSVKITANYAGIHNVYFQHLISHCSVRIEVYAFGRISGDTVLDVGDLSHLSTIPARPGNWTISDTNIAFIDPVHGNVTARSAGTAVITHTYTEVGCTETTKLTVNGETGVPFVNTADIISITPNPVKDVFILNCLHTIECVDVFNLLGEKVTGVVNVRGTNDIQFNISDLPSGVYLVKINNLWVRRVIKQ